MTDSQLDESSAWPFVKTAVSHDVVDSTSDQAAALVRDGSCALPLLVRARRQTRGRGRGSHEWWSDEGSLTFTLAIDPTRHGLTVENEPKLALATAVAVIDALVDLDLYPRSLGIRWPNDLEADGRKLGGILPERIETRLGHRILVGIGLNVRTNLAEAPAEVRAMATSLHDLFGRTLDDAMARTIMRAILVQFELVLERLVLDDPSLPDQWNRLDVLRDKWVRINQGIHVVTGRGRGIDRQGALCLDDGEQEHHICGGSVLRDDWPSDAHTN
jgi:BirA family biotin operon repressor/biotin-[acetyl-CoA-carboxylase] ligase